MVVGPAFAGDLDIVADETDGFFAGGAFFFREKNGGRTEEDRLDVSGGVAGEDGNAEVGNVDARRADRAHLGAAEGHGAEAVLRREERKNPVFCGNGDGAGRGGRRGGRRGWWSLRAAREHGATQGGERGKQCE